MNKRRSNRHSKTAVAPRGKSARSSSPAPSETGSKPAWLAPLFVVIGGVALLAAGMIGWQLIPDPPAGNARTADGAGSQQGRVRANAVDASGRLPVFPGLENNRFDAVVRSVARREDPLVDGWDSERFSENADAQFKIIGKMLTEPKTLDRDHAEQVAADTFASTAIRPTELQEVFRDTSLVVRRPVGQASDSGSDSAEESAAELLGPDALLAALGAQAEPLANLSGMRFKFKTVRVDLADDGAQTTTYFQVGGRDERQAVQVNATWHCQWQFVEGSATPVLASVRVENYEEIVYVSEQGKMFADCTESVFRNSDCFRPQLIYGIDHWTDRFDGAIARPAAGHGIAIGDVNGDGLEDVYMCQSPGLPNLLLIQQPDGTVIDTAAEAGVNWLEGTRAALLADLDNDGDQDLVAVLGAKVVIQANDGTGRFALQSIVDSASSLFAINAVDYDGDRDLDLFFCGYTLVAGVKLDDVFANPMPFHDANNGAPNIMLRNDGQWAFTDVTREVGLDENNMRFSYASAWDDIDNDGDLDVYVANDFGRNNLYRNDGGRFADVAPVLNVEDIGPGMSAAWGDFNNDGHADLYVSNMFSSAGNRITHQDQFKTDLDEAEKRLFRRHARGNSLFENTGGGEFLDRSVDLGVTLGRWAWGSLFVDLNNDGWEDLYVTNGFITADNNNDL